MNNIVRQRLAEIVTAAAVTAVLATTITAGVFIINKRESERVARELLPIAEKALALAGNRYVQTEVPVRGRGTIRKVILYETKAGKTIGAGFSIRMETFSDGMGLFVVTDEKGRMRSLGAWPGVSGVRAEELRTFLRQRERGATGGLDPSADAKALEYSVDAAVDEAARFMRSREGSKK